MFATHVFHIALYCPWHWAHHECTPLQ